MAHVGKNRLKERHQVDDAHIQGRVSQHRVGQCGTNVSGADNRQVVSLRGYGKKILGSTK